MASPSPNSSSVGRPKRSAKPIIPALPLIPGPKKPVTSKTEPVETETSKKVVGASPNHGNVVAKSPIAHPAEVETAGQATRQHEEKASEAAATGIPVTTQELAGNQLNESAVSDAASGVKDVDDVEVSAIGTGTNVPSQDRPEHRQPQLGPAEAQDQATNDPTMNKDKKPAPAGPLIVDSSVPRRPENLTLGSESDLRNGSRTSYSFAAPTESQEVSPVRMNGIPNNATSMGFPGNASSFAPPPMTQMVSPMTAQWTAGDKQALPYAPPMQPPPLVTSNFSAAAPVFTPASGTPPYSLSSTPAIASTGATPLAELGPRFSHPSIHNTNGFVSPFDQRQYPQPPQSLSHAHGDQRHASAQGRHHRGHESDTYRMASVEPDGLQVSLSEHLTSLFESGHLSDWRINVYNRTKAFAPLGLSAHGVVISRNSVLNERMQSMGTQSKNPSTNDIYIEWHDTFIHPSSFNYALRYLYNGQLPTKADVEQITYDSQIPDQWRQLQLHFALSFYLSGMTLNIGAISRHGRDLVKVILDWDLIEIALSWAIDYRPKDFSYLTGAFGAAMSRSGSSRSYQSDTSSSSRSRGLMPVSSSLPLKNDPNGNPLVISKANSDLLKELVVFFLADKVAFESFVFEPTAKPSQLRSRLPITRETAAALRHVPNNALQGISFGDFTGGSEARGNLEDGSYQSRVASTAFINLPYKELNGLLILLQRKNDPRVYEFAKQIVADRENLRLQALRSKSVTLQERENNMVEWVEVGFHEYISDIRGDPAESSQVNGVSYDSSTSKFRLARTWKGLDNPAPGTKKKTGKKQEQNLNEPNPAQEGKPSGNESKKWSHSAQGGQKAAASQ